MRVWIQNPFDNLPSEGYRKQRFFLMAEAFARAGHDTTLWTADFSHGTKQFRRDAPERIGDVRLKLVPTLPYRSNVCLARVRSHAAYAKEWTRLASGEPAPDAIVASTPTISGAEAAIKLGRVHNAFVAIDVMDAWPETFERLAPPLLRPAARLALASLRRRARSVYRDAGMVSGVCERYRALSGRDDFYLAYHGVEMPSSPPPMKDGHLRFAYIGGTGRTYDLDTVIEGVHRIPGATLDIAGNWNGKCDSSVMCHGYLGEDALRAMLDKCSVGVIPMEDDSWVGLPYKLGDYARAGLRILTSLGGECRAIVERHRAGAWYAPHDPAAFASTAARLSSACDAASYRGLQQALDAAGIYAAYVRKVEQEVGRTRR